MELQSPVTHVSTSFPSSLKRQFTKRVLGIFVEMKNGGSLVIAKNIETFPTKRQLLETVHACTSCERMSCSRRVLSELNGDWSARVVFIAEAPGRLGAEKTGIPLFGDRTGDRFEELLSAM